MLHENVSSKVDFWWNQKLLALSFLIKMETVTIVFNWTKFEEIFVKVNQMYSFWKYYV